jgi:hypothetical protein
MQASLLRPNALPGRLNTALGQTPNCLEKYTLSQSAA